MKENQHTEWKESWRDDYLRWVCGFANAEGGTLVIGRNDRGEAVGMANAARLLEEIPNKVRDVLGIMVDVNLLVEGGKELLEIRVEPYPNPISYKGEYHFRSGSTKQELKGAALSHFLLKKQGLHWDGVALPGLKVGDLDAGALALFRQQAVRSQRLPDATQQEPDVALLERLHLLEGGVCKRATALLFHADPGRWFTGAFVKIGFFESNADLLYQDEVNGPLLVQVNKTIEVLQAKYMKALISYDGLQRVETWPVPLPALREAVLNAVVHKDYTSGAPIQISVYADKLMIWNSGRLSPEWTVKRLLGKHASAPFNPDVANAFFRGGQIESWGRGIERMVQACLDAGLQAPVLELEDGGVWVTFAFAPVKPLLRGEKWGEKWGERTTATRLALVQAMRRNPQISTVALAAEVGMASTSGVEKHLKALRDAGCIRRVGPAKGGTWEVLEDVL